ncbi:hypothetical protein HXA34_18505 [Salipaludibacillus agaradhaerens]|uniref:hypothetical protein n=1 Tax=Salipaludibacillus agaradhaerens TaxID=76935 RepID=UPI002151C22A|nr:hypothetical protein [Salipaludibacillus agaradhaerens]MCR6108292.1 hypothetical protein [Salipaludibacillus agaradhaerens]MCR6120317.1 hypothetical protein [Salipaludibacillus agaradhaerens]
MKRGVALLIGCYLVEKMFKGNDLKRDAPCREEVPLCSSFEGKGVYRAFRTGTT